MNIGTFLGYGASALSPWMRRQADNAVFSFEVIDNPDEVTVTFTLYMKDTNDYGTPSSGQSMGAISGGVSIYNTIEDIAGLKEMVRIGITVGTTAEEVPNGTGITYRLFETTWYDGALG
jgi:hypothetical protein